MPCPRLLGKRIEHLRVVDEFDNCLYQFSLDREHRVPKSATRIISIWCIASLTTLNALAAIDFGICFERVSE